MSNTYVIGDIHGQYDQLIDLVEKMNVKDEDTLIIMGDVVDRGPDSVKALQYLMMMPNARFLIGNHEVMALKCLYLLTKEVTEEFISSLDENNMLMLIEWFQNGGQSTMEQFSKLPAEDKKDIIEFLEEFEPYIELEVNGQEYVLVHAGLGNDFCCLTPLDEYPLDDLIWCRPDYEIPYYEDRIVVTGHTPTQSIADNPRPGFIYRKHNHIALDCGACSKEGRLAGICLDTGKEYYSKET